MAKITESGQEQSGNPVMDAVEAQVGEISIATTPVLICGVNRKINIGDYENIDIYAGLTIPMVGADPSNVEAFKKYVEDAAELGFQLVSSETFERYRKIKEMQAPAYKK